LSDVLATVYATLVGFAWAVLVGVGLGVPIARIRSASRAPPLRSDRSGGRRANVVEYARKALIGLLTPQANTTVEPEFFILYVAWLCFPQCAAD
jgi:hypothetical protein